MNFVTTKPRPDDRALDLVGAFVESSDARLRGNAIQALVALTNSEHEGLAGRAEQTLAEAIVNGPASAEAEWQRRFRSRALDAMIHLAPPKRSRILEHARTTHRRSKDALQRAALASFLLEANAAGLLPRPANWLGLRRLTKSLATVGVLRAVWQASWRLVVAAIFIFLVILAAPQVLPLGWELDSAKALSQFLSYAYLVVLPLMVLAMVTLVGRLQLQIRERLVEVAICTVTFATISVLGTTALIADNWIMNWQSADDFLAASAVDVVIVGAVVGVAVRLLKWLSDTELMVMCRAKLILAALVVTIVSMVAAQCGMDQRAAGACWIVLAPTAVAAVSLDSWLETIGPNLAPLAEKPPATRALVLVAVSFVVGCIFVVFVGYRNFSNAFPQPTASTAETAGDNLIEQEVKPHHRLELNVKKAGTYTIYAAPGDGKSNIILTVKKKGAGTITEDHNREKQSEETTQQLPEGKAVICVFRANQQCNYEVDLIDFAAAFVAGEPVSAQDESLNLSIKIFASEKRPSNIPAGPPGKSQ